MDDECFCSTAALSDPLSYEIATTKGLYCYPQPGCLKLTERKSISTGIGPDIARQIASEIVNREDDTAEDKVCSMRASR
jgi:hypothetical protein